MEEGDKGGQKKDPTVEGTDTDQHTTSDHSPEQKSDSEGGKYILTTSPARNRLRALIDDPDFGKGNES